MITGIIIIFLMVLLMIIFKTRINFVNQFLFYSIAIILSVYTSFRDENSVNDYIMYIGAWYWSTYETTVIEASFLFIRNILRDDLKLNYISIFIVYAILGIFPKLIAIKNLSTNFYLAVLIYISHFFILHEMTQMRAGVAAGFILLAIAPLYNRNLKYFLFFIFLASVFHYSAVLMFALWFVRSNSKVKFLYFIVPLGILFYAVGFNFIQNIPIPYFQTKLDTYRKLTEQGTDGMDKINVFNAFYIIRVLLFYFLLVNSKKIATKSKYFYLLLRMEGLSLFALPALSLIPAIAFRVHELLGIIEIILFPLLVYAFRVRIIGYIFVIIIAITFLCVNIFYNKLIIF